MKIWLVCGNCGDFYCERMHVLAVSNSAHGAKLLAQAAAEKTRVMATDDAYTDITVDGPLKLGELCLKNFRS